MLIDAPRRRLERNALVRAGNGDIAAVGAVVTGGVPRFVGRSRNTPPRCATSGSRNPRAVRFFRLGALRPGMRRFSTGCHRGRRRTRRGDLRAGAGAQGLRSRWSRPSSEINRNPRAATTHPATLEMLADLDLLRRHRGAGLVARYFQFWDRVSGRKVAEFDHDSSCGHAAFRSWCNASSTRSPSFGWRGCAPCPTSAIRHAARELTGFAQDDGGA